MTKHCPKCEKINDAGIRICTCGFQFFKPEEIHSLPDFALPPRNSLKARITKIIAYGVFLILGLGTIVLLIGFPGLISFTTENQKDHAAFVENNLPNSDARPQANAQPLRKYSIQGKVTSVTSGDHIIVYDDSDGRPEEVRLAGVQAPGVDQELGQKAQKNLADLILDKTVFVLVRDLDGQDLYVGKVLLDDTDINLEQLRSGAVRRNESPGIALSDIDQNLYDSVEQTAKAARIGLWSDEQTVSQDEVVAPAEDYLRQESGLVPQSAGDRKGTGTRAFVRASQPTAKKQRVGAENRSGASPTARCGDGTSSYSQTRSGSCSNHGGVADWFGAEKQSSAKSKKLKGRKYIKGPLGGCFYVSSSGSKTYVDRSLCN